MLPASAYMYTMKHSQKDSEWWLIFVLSHGISDLNITWRWIWRSSEESSWSSSCGTWIYNYLCNQCLSPLMLWFESRSWWGVLDTTLYDKACQWLVTGRCFLRVLPFPPPNKTNRHDITEILLKVALNTITLPLTVVLISIGELSTIL